METVKSIKLPKYRQQKRKGRNLAFVELSGHRHYLGPYGSRESKQVYKRLLTEWLANGKRLPVDPKEITDVHLNHLFSDILEQAAINPSANPPESPIEADSGSGSA